MKLIIPSRRTVLALTGLLVVLSTSCVQPPPPRTYNPKVARHLHRLSHDTPVTPIPSAYGGWGYYRSCYYGY